MMINMDIVSQVELQLDILLEGKDHVIWNEVLF